MAHYIYEGDPGGGSNPDRVRAFGIRFEQGRPVKVDNEAICAKLDANGHFRKVDGQQATKALRKSGQGAASGDVHQG